MPHRAHWQPVEYNALHGGLERWFEPIEPAVVAAPAWQRMLLAMGRLASGLRGAQPWYVEAHQFRIDTTDGIGRPTPEGAHRDGVDLVAVVLVGREGIKGGETRVFDADGPNGLRFTMQEPWTCLLLDDARVIHESTPIQPLEGVRASRHAGADAAREGVPGRVLAIADDLGRPRRLGRGRDAVRHIASRSSSRRRRFRPFQSRRRGRSCLPAWRARVPSRAAGAAADEPS